MSSTIVPVILSGGSGTRLWPMSRGSRPKQFLPLVDAERSMLQLTLDRCVRGDRFGPPVIVGNAAHVPFLMEQCEDPDARIILEPMARNTAPAIALAALTANPDDLLLIMPSDHAIADIAAFHAAVATAAGQADAGRLVTFGIVPTFAETGYGYIRRGPEMAAGAFAVDRFVEKPDAATAQGYLEEGGYYWNAGIFLFRAADYLDALAHFAPDMLAAVRDAIAGARREGRLIYPDADAFARSPSDSIDYAIMEKAARVVVVPVDMGWSDIGSWDALYDLLEKDADGLAASGDALCMDSRDCLVHSDGPLVTLHGVRDLIVVATPDAVMILPRGSSQSARHIIDALKVRGHGSLD